MEISPNFVDFISLFEIFKKIQPYRSPDLADHNVRLYYWHEFKIYEKKEISEALDKLIRSQDYFPTVRQIHASLNHRQDDDSLSQITAMNLIEAISKFGWPNWPEAKEYIGTIGIKIVDRYGGWPDFCGMLTLDNRSFIYKELKEMAKSLLTSGALDHKALPPGSPHELVKRLVDATNMKPETKSLSVSDKATIESELPW